MYDRKPQCTGRHLYQSHWDYTVDGSHTTVQVESLSLLDHWSDSILGGPLWITRCGTIEEEHYEVGKTEERVNFTILLQYGSVFFYE